MHYIKEVLKKNKYTVFIYLLIGIGNAFLANYKADYYRKIVDGLAEGNLTLAGIFIYGAVLITYYCLNYVDEYPAKKLEHGIYLDFKLLALGKISRIDYLEYSKIGTGKLVQRIENGAEAGKNVLYDFWFCVIRQLLPTIGFGIYFIWKLNHTVTYMILSGYVVIFIVTNLLLKVLYRLKEKILNQEERLNHFLVRGFMEMLVFRMERQFSGEMKKATAAKEDIVSSKVKMNLIHEAFFTIFALLVAGLNIGILVYAWKSRTMSVGSVVALLTLIENAYTPIAIFNVLYVQYKLDWSAYRRFNEFLQLKEDEQLKVGQKISNLQGEVCVDNLTFCYGDRKLFDKLSLSIKKGEKVAFVGESGSGKSTLAKMMAGLIKYESGSIRIDGKEVRKLCLDSLYGQMGYLSQDAPVFDGTLRENLVFEKEMPEQRLTEVLQRVQLSVLLKNLENGLDTEIGERGTMLSGGEKQRLALARLWLKKPDIAILDEATSAMDNLTEKQVMKEVLSELKDQTVIAIAHRLSSVADFDKIVVFHQGKIVGQGTFEELLENNAYFRELCRASKEQREECAAI